MTTTRAEIPAEAAAAQHSEYDPAVPIEFIGIHPDNIRHDATADDELVASIREKGLVQPLVLVPGRAGDNAYRLIAGHRRLDALKRAGFTHTPAVIRHDLHDKADQLAAMLVENGRRADLTPIEEAEGFDLLSELGWTLDHIAESTGRSKSTVRARRRLTKLPDKARGAVHDGQVHIEHAIALAELPAAEQADLERHLGGSGFKYELERAKVRVARQAEVDQQITDLKARGVEGHELPDGVYNAFMLNHADHGMVRIEHTGVTEPDQHDECLAFVNVGTKQYPDVALVCTDPSNHDDQLTEQQRQRREEQATVAAEREQRITEIRERQEGHRIARGLRCDAALSLVKANPKIDPGLEAVLRVALPELLRWDTPPDLADMLDVPEEHRHPYGSPTDEWIAEIRHATTPQLVKYLAAYLVADIESRVADIDADIDPAALEDHERDLVRSWFAVLDQAGHEHNDVDEELLAVAEQPEED